MFPSGFTYYTFIDGLAIIVWLTIVLAIAYNRKAANIDKPHYKWYMRNMYANLSMGLLFGVLYINILGGGDTEAYFMGSTVLSNLFLDSPNNFFHFINIPFTYDYNSIYFDLKTGYPPGWIFREEQGYFVSKLLTPVNLICFKSYWAMTILFSYFSAQASWKLFEFARSYNLNNEKLLAFGVLLLPSVNFWCSGVSKDTIVYIATIYLVYHAFQIMSADKKATLKNYVLALIAAFLIYKIRSFILAAILLPMLFSLSARGVKALGGGDNAVIIIRTLALIIGLGIGTQILVNSSEDILEQSSALKEAAIIQGDFAKNEDYGDKKYDIGTIEFSTPGLVRIAPFAILAGIYKPLIWEATSLTLIMNGIESIIFLYFTLVFFKGKPWKKWKKIRAHEFLIFCVIFVFIIAFMTGLTSGLYGVLVRLRAPLLPFLLIVLTVDFTNVEKEGSKNELHQLAVEST